MYDFGQWEEAGVARNYIATKKTCKLREAKNFVVKPHSEPPHHCAIPVSPLFTTLTIIYVIIMSLFPLNIYNAVTVFFFIPSVT